MYISSCCAAAAQRSFAIPDFLLHIFYREEEQQLLTGASKQASRQRGLSTQWEFISKVPDSRLKLMSSCEGKRRRCFAIAALLNWKSNQKYFYFTWTWNSIHLNRSSLCTRQQQKSESQATHFLLSIHRFFMIFLCVSLFVCLLPFYIYLHIFYLYFIYLWFSAKKMKERKKD